MASAGAGGGFDQGPAFGRPLVEAGFQVVAMSRYELERLAVPTLIISVENDLFGTYRSARYTAEHVRGARFVGYLTGGHLWVGHQKEVWSEVVGFLNTQQRERESVSEGSQRRNTAMQGTVTSGAARTSACPSNFTDP